MAGTLGGTVREAIVEFLKENGSTSAGQLDASLSSKFDGDLNRTLDALVEEQIIKRSQGGNYFVPGFITKKPATKPVATSKEPIAISFGVNTPTGRGITCDGQTLSPGDVFTNRDLVRIFRVGNSGGIRVSKAAGAVLLTASVDNSLYKDRQEGDTFMYTGEGAYGDQKMNRGNLAVADSMILGRPLLLFFKRDKNAYEFQGEMRLSGEPASEQQEDESGQMRRVFVFPLVHVPE